jgi:hypothetical protein
MSSIKEWVLQVRYPYAAAVIAIMWVGTAIFVFLSPPVPLEPIIGLLSLATLFVAVVGFTSPK